MLTDANCALCPPTLADLEAAAIRLAPFARATPLLESMRLNDRLGGRLLLKAESLQQTGSFKFRGALNRLLLIPLAKRQAGVVAFSSGNHAQGVAAAARLLGMPATILMPDDAPATKIANTRDYGADIVLFNRISDDRETIGADLARDRGATLVKPYDDGGIIAGQGTVGLEIALDCRERNLTPNDVLVNCSGGGLAAGIALALAGPFPNSQIWAAEPVGFDDTARSLRSGRRQSNERNSGSICDALMASMPGELTLPLLATYGVQGVAVDDDTVKRAIHTAWRDFKLVVEPGGAVALAAALSGLTPVANRTVIAVASGGNIDAALFRTCLELPPL